MVISDHRINPRRIFRTAVKVILDEQHSYNAKSIDISISGICLIVPGKNLAIDSLCVLHFDLVAQGKVHRICLAAKVVYSICGSEGFKVGFSFSTIDARCKAAIQTFIS